MFEIAFKSSDDLDAVSKVTTQSLIARFVQQFNERQKAGTDSDRWDNSGDDDDIIVNEMSDDENDMAKNSNNAAIVEVFVEMVRPISEILASTPKEAFNCQFTA